MTRIDSTVTGIRPIARDYFHLEFLWPDGAGTPAPGSFVTIRSGGPYDPVLRRPFAFSSHDPARGRASVIFQLRGRGTAYLASLKPGDDLDVLGPLGKGFTAPPPGHRPVLVAGGIGLGPMLYLAYSLSTLARSGACEAPVLALGFRAESQVPDLALPPGTAICTDDGSSGFHGTAAAWLDGFDPGLPPVLYTCGPAPLMAAVARYAQTRGAACQAAVEQWMACGVGACAGCAVRMKDGSFLKACSDGPVLDGLAVDWEA